MPPDIPGLEPFSPVNNNMIVGNKYSHQRNYYNPAKYDRAASQCSVYICVSVLEVCMRMGKTGIPWVPWDSHGNGSKISPGMGMGWDWEWELSAWEWELRRGSCHQQL